MTANTRMSKFWHAVTTVVADVRDGFVEITHHGLAVLGLAVVTVSLTFAMRPDLQATASEVLMGWLQMRQVENLDIPIAHDAASRSTATVPKNLPPHQLAVTYWLSRKYHVAPEPLAALVSEAWAVGERTQIAPTLILAVMAIESRFNPFALGSQGGMGLMQIEPQMQKEALQAFGGRLAAFDPVTNLRVGSRHLQALMQQTASLEEALAQYALSSGQSDDSLYAERVLNEQKQLDRLPQVKALSGSNTATQHAWL